MERQDTAVRSVLHPFTCFSVVSTALDITYTETLLLRAPKDKTQQL